MNKFNKYSRFSHVMAQPSLTYLNERLWINICGDFNTGEQITDFVRRTTICGSGKSKCLEAMSVVNRELTTEEIDKFLNEPKLKGTQNIHATTRIFKNNKTTLLFLYL